MTIPGHSTYSNGEHMSDCRKRYRVTHERSQSTLSPPLRVGADCRGHRTYLDPNPRLIATRTKVSRIEAPKGHRRFVVL